MTINDIAKKINESKNIAITFHESPDGDAIGSTLALMHSLRKMKKNVKVISKESTPDYLKFLPFSCEIDGKNSKLPEDIDCLIVLDCGDVKRINAENVDFHNKSYCVINIDHHPSNEMYGDYNYVDSSSIAVAQIIYQLLENLNVCIDKDIATNLYTSIITDSGSFKHSGTTSLTHIIAGHLIDIGINFNEIHRNVFENKPFDKIKSYGKIIENMYLTSKKKLCIIKIKENILDGLDIKIDDIGDSISFGMQVDTVEVTAMLKEWNNGTKISLRSKRVVDVRKIAENFNGGGHVRAAGLFLDLPIDDAEKVIIKAIEKELI